MTPIVPAKSAASSNWPANSTPRSTSHLDVGDGPEALDISLVCELTETHRRGGRIAVGHMAKLSTIPPDRLAFFARRMADAGVAVAVLPLTDLFVMGRDQEHNVRRGVADANFLIAHGVNCTLSTKTC
jgi:cytosine deaminase